MAEAQAPSGASAKDNALMAVGILVLLAGIVAFYWFDERPLVIRTAMVIGGLAAAAGILWTSWYGREFWQFAQAARVELRKVVWPDRDETLKTFYTVIVFAAIMGVFFWLLDLFFSYVMRLIGGQTG